MAKGAGLWPCAACDATLDVAVFGRCASASSDSRYNARPFCSRVSVVVDTFVAGQRWLSEAEPDLGLGLVEEVDQRHVLVRFAASGQQRTYAARNAPLSRVRLGPDDKVRDPQGRELTVVRVDERGPLLAYHCVDDAGVMSLLPEQLLDDRLQLNRPQDKLLARRIDADVWFTLRYQSWLQSAAMWRRPAFGMQGPRIELIPHQLYIAAEVASRALPRVLLADEVGLGKTIEAGLILHRMILTERVRRVLVVLPDALVHQWLVEMLRRFNLPFAVFDQERFEQSDSDNAFHSEQRVLCSLSLLTGSPEVAQAALDGEWDLLIVDEAHHLTWSEDDSSLAYQLVEALAARTPGVLLLTATPEQLGRAGHFGRLRLLDPSRYHDYRAFLAEEEAYAPVASVAAHLLDGQVLQPDESALLTDLLGDEAGLGSEQIIARLIDRHGTGRVLFRNTRHAIKGFPARRLHAHALASPPAYAPFAAQLQPERSFGQGWTDVDPRVPWLRTLLGELAPDKVLVICAHAATAIALRDHLLDRHAVHAALFHEHMEIVARDRAAAFFADSEEGAQVLICSEIGSEGRNFQFAHHLVLFDLPLEPDLLEQRIGRLDRIGQRATIELHVPYLEGTAAEVLLRWYRDGLASFETVCPAASVVFDRLGGQLDNAMADPGQVDRLVAEAAALTATINTDLEAGRDRLLELHSFQPRRAAGLLQSLQASDGVTPLAEFMTAYWDAFGVEHEAGPGHSLIVHPGTHMLHEHFPGLAGEAVTVTFDRSDALAHEDRQFLTWEHPMTRGCMEMLTSGELGSAAVTVASHPDYRTGSALLEILFIAECVAPPGLEVQRYLPPTCLRLLLDAQGEDKSRVLSHEQLQGLCLAQNRKLADTVIKTQRDRIKLLLQLAEQSVARDNAALVRRALRDMESEMDAEQQRLTALSRVNPNVSQVEIDLLAQRRQLLAQHIRAAKVRLDAVRVVVMR
ncbi:MAG: RNA polymerase-associated protein RapA [Chromatiaceae bacterium]|nr:RNA polymerase-associated protein RapA [Chromatiaceae bacterium]